jgi:hypothetical protein
MADREVSMKRSIYFDRFRGEWPSLQAIEGFFLAPGGRQWSFLGGNDSWGIDIEGLYGTERSAELDRVNAAMTMVGNLKLGVYLCYDRWDGRVRKKYSYNSKGDLGRLGEFVESLHETPLSVGLFVPFPVAWIAVKQFMETDGELPDGIEWVTSEDLPPGTFPAPQGPG